MKDAIRRRALELGFDACGFTSAAPPESAAHFQEWLARGFHGGMSYLARNAEKRVRPELVLAGVRSVVTLAVSYHRDAPDERPAAALPPGTDTVGPVGIVARYARHADYHDVIGERLERLATEMDRLAGEVPSSLWYVDTGPILERDLAQRAGVGFVGKHGKRCGP